MQVQEPSNKLTNLQLELLKIFAYSTSEQELLEIKDMLTKYFAEKAGDEFEKMAEEKGWTAETYVQWAHEHNRASNSK